jgi:polysaccharide export outer membrane protein
MSRKWISASTLLVLALALGGCASNPFPPAPPQIAAFDYWYVIGPGDSVNIQVWRNPELSMTVTVRPDGRITGPLVEDIAASGKTPTQLAREMEKVLSKYVQSPVVTVIVGGFVGPYSEQIRVIGEAARPQALPYRQYMTLLDVMIAVGGITDFAAGNKASILRQTDGKKEQLGVRLIDLVRGGDLSANVAMRPGDILVIPQSFF